MPDSDPLTYEEVSAETRTDLIKVAKFLFSSGKETHCPRRNKVVYSLGDCDPFWHCGLGGDL